MPTLASQVLPTVVLPIQSLCALLGSVIMPCMKWILREVQKAQLQNFELSTVSYCYNYIQCDAVTMRITMPSKSASNISTFIICPACYILFSISIIYTEYILPGKHFQSWVGSSPARYIDIDCRYINTFEKYRYQYGHF